MSNKYKFTDKEAVYFGTATVVDWVDVFTGNNYLSILFVFTFYQYLKLNTRLLILPPLSIVFIKLFCYFLNGYSKLADYAANDKRFTTWHQVHVLCHIHVLHQPFAGYP